MLVLLIVKCPDPSMWYHSFIGKTVPYEGGWRDTPDVFKSREPAGYVNIVKRADAVIMDPDYFNPQFMAPCGQKLAGVD